ncbi:MAG: helix-turn-helix domain-containing protein [Synergistaceae bacterium]|nr:helix-turn-helix domain-containing protein [Synergistaceae bacterium]
MSIANRVREQTPTVDCGALQLLLDEKKAARLLGVSLSYLRKSRCDGTIRERTPAPTFVYVGNRVYYRTADLKAWVEGLAGRAVV